VVESGYMPILRLLLQPFNDRFDTDRFYTDRFDTDDVRPTSKTPFPDFVSGSASLKTLRTLYRLITY
jgi:hypothetical protein